MLKSDIWNMITTYYITSPVWLVLSVVSVIYLACCADKDGRKKILLCFLFTILTILNEVSYHVLIKFFDQASYYRFLWVVPYGLIVAYALMRCILDLADRGNRKKEAVLLLATVVGILFVTQGNYVQRLMSDIPQNKYLVMDDILEIQSFLDTERANGQIADEPVIACPKNVMLQYQTLDAGCLLSTSRFVYLNIRDYGADISQYEQPWQDKYLLTTICEDSMQPDLMEAKEAILREQIDYMIVHANVGMESYMEQLGCTMIGQTPVYLIYRVDCGYDNRTVEQVSVQEKENVFSFSIHEDEIVIDLGLQDDYTILALNDMHILLMDDTVTDTWRETVWERFGSMFINETGIHSADMWNGMSAILDSYDANGIVFIGDMIDYGSETNAQLLSTGLKKIKTPWIYLRADHDLGTWYTEDGLSAGDALRISSGIAEWQDVFIMDYKEFYLVGWNNSTSQLSEKGLTEMKSIFAKAMTEGKPIILATHVPINSTVEDGLKMAARAADEQGRIKLWGEGCLYQPNDTTAEFLDMVLANDSPVQAVLAGHLHIKHTAKLNERITEYVLDKSFSGNIGVIRIK